ncbi:MAG TPA: hypothetical protein VGA36_08570 [Nitriliruptorales bacterium]
MPVVSGLVACLLLIMVLPSALNIPQSQPEQTLEFAPIPPEDDTPPPQDQGNVESLSLGSSTSAPGDAPGGAQAGPPALPPIPEGVGGRPVTKRCVGDPPRQTEDPLSPPCVAHFEGDNGGATHTGVDAEEIRILVYADGKTAATESGAERENLHKGDHFDLGEPPPEDEAEPITVRVMRRFQTYFNDRFQMYGRTARFTVVYNSPAATTPESRRADAAEHIARFDPFAVITSGLIDGGQDAYTDFMAANGVLVFGSPTGSRSEDFYQRYPGQVWSYLPTLERRADSYASLVCTQVINRPVSDGQIAAGQQRVLGLLTSADPGFPSLQVAARMIEERIVACGGQIDERATFPVANRRYSTGDPSYATQNMVSFSDAGVTTIIWPGGFESEQSKAAARIGYRPEWIIAGDTHHEGLENARAQDQSAWDHATVVTSLTRPWPQDQDPCVRAMREVDPGMSDPHPEVGNDMSRACYDFLYYQDLRTVFTGIQVAGPNLTPATMDRGFHAIPAIPSDDPRVPACFYDPGDYTCIKDAMVQQWDSNATAWDSQPGCWRMTEDGRRYLVGTWPATNIDEPRAPDDICNSYNRATQLY